MEGGRLSGRACLSQRRVWRRWTLQHRGAWVAGQTALGLHCKLLLITARAAEGLAANWKHISARG